jgi:putative iron-regulated protein
MIMGGVEALVTQTASIQRAMLVLGLTAAAFEGSESLDNPAAVFQ